MHPDDLPPELAWEKGIWWLYLRVQTQWRVTAFGRRTGLDYGPAIAIIRALGWNLPFALELLQCVERQELTDGETSDG
ncbi:DUF1799 domain-containing protein [Propionivibrio sp.]|uniref:DUF1799 domain-containing protein n=1 Tax=Propionivibrio sp. TaxID=2212460 RepID=UPI0039E22DC1